MVKHNVHEYYDTKVIKWGGGKTSAWNNFITLNIKLNVARTDSEEKQWDFNKVYETEGEIITSIRIDTGSLCAVNISQKKQPSHQHKGIIKRLLIQAGSHKLALQSLSRNNFNRVKNQWEQFL